MPSNTIFPQVPLSSQALSDTSKAAGKYGVPLNIVRGVTTYKFGAQPSTDQINYTAQQLSQWYKTLFPRYGGSVLVNWVRAAAATMGQQASNQDVLVATGNQQVAITNILNAPFWSSIASLVGDVSGAAGSGFGTSNDPGITETGSASGTSTAGQAAAGGAGSSVASKALTTAKSLTTAATLAGILADPNFALRIVEIIAGVALMFLGLKALTRGSPVVAQTHTVTRVAKAVVK